MRVGVAPATSLSLSYIKRERRKRRVVDVQRVFVCSLLDDVQRGDAASDQDAEVIDLVCNV